MRRNQTLQLGPEKAALLGEQLRRDADFLKRMHICDYSLLIGIHKMTRGNKDHVRRNTLQMFDVRPPFSLNVLYCPSPGPYSDNLSLPHVS